MYQSQVSLFKSYDIQGQMSKTQLEIPQYISLERFFFDFLLFHTFFSFMACYKCLWRISFLHMVKISLFYIDFNLFFN